ncbi:Mur ligase family protein [Lyticum sinuosum]|uniref:UDP-N-acetylmuramoyl-L-alanyl-D-glutamate--2,6-diaminopimelate ligase n=1 Tax=Lyticum sinuosum TaxID=1332059 RepID=A0AAE4VJV2_9RICK|nr:UDP-N-acetylmuramoyl-L-alanyl-D-glutamate--2,6-diaminopimelate ligase [Lyticum sinuosum]MDZ5761256.1 UDP-N-acetylmuramoyl-L-alanyl-D-glutamate--2,6-diaminopimelate ligase [Lyticum sinuosum]
MQKNLIEKILPINYLIDLLLPENLSINLKFKFYEYYKDNFCENDISLLETLDINLILNDIKNFIISNNIYFPQIESDHRKIETNAIFFAIPGVTFDGSNFISSAIDNGAKYVIIPTTIENSILNSLLQLDIILKKSVFLYKTKNIRRAYAMFCSLCYPKQPDKIIGVTGTNGKTSSAHFYSCISSAYSRKNSVYIGTLGETYCYFSQSKQKVMCRSIDNTNHLTTPDSKTIHKTLNYLTNYSNSQKINKSKIKQSTKIDHVAIEASSHGLHQNRLDFVNFKSVAFTNLTHDHLDYHTDINNYFLAKLRLFTEITSDIVVLNINDEFSYKILQYLHKDKKIIFYGRIINNNNEIINNNHFFNKNFLINKLNESYIKDITDHNIISTVFFYDYTPGIGFTLVLNQKHYICKTDIIGEFQIQNLLCGISLFLSVKPDADIDKLISIIPLVSQPPGRMQKISQSNIYVDYSHTPDGLLMALTELKKTYHQKLWLVFGCGGNRDRDKRRKMAQIASSIADYIIITDDNPRQEDPALIRQEIIIHCDKNLATVIEIGNRKDAINYAITNATIHDIILIAGRGHEKYQIVGNKKFIMSDIKIAEEYFKQIKRII